ncbi:hypothetical protein CLOM_g12731 [Closterium sp. NIES-68]|nr:hypothetical protein CLOM_g12731 [Closterium sp. NIES-68]GJP69376.1 hypothetical protein CLOP_g311 [Closterium sp. NIES-67]
MPCKGHGGIEGVAIAVALTTAKVVAGLGTSGGVVALVQEEEANLISLRKLGQAGVSTTTNGSKTFKGLRGDRVLWD